MQFFSMIVSSNIWRGSRVIKDAHGKPIPSNQTALQNICYFFSFPFWNRQNIQSLLPPISIWLSRCEPGLQFPDPAEHWGSPEKSVIPENPRGAFHPRLQRPPPANGAGALKTARLYFSFIFILYIWKLPNYISFSLSFYISLEKKKRRVSLWPRNVTRWLIAAPPGFPWAPLRSHLALFLRALLLTDFHFQQNCSKYSYF